MLDGYDYCILQLLSGVRRGIATPALSEGLHDEPLFAVRHDIVVCHRRAGACHTIT